MNANEIVEKFGGYPAFFLKNGNTLETGCRTFINMIQAQHDAFKNRCCDFSDVLRNL